ncbi:carboxymuconolactone decarboxylase family protein [Sphingobium amiense]|uniref:Carboxymuconolactone decarboxylase family protein n=1 Tax=Sphingobium amiense TaxID=135719 RepID=A0A494W5J6_9SPHN|nr:carboxymuconolactone decarboxylase family protein [Sphingobium amiense]BBD98448.1 carboxymuconolactone decarboxylase family protein [Sphingobium amiense]
MNDRTNIYSAGGPLFKAWYDLSMQVEKCGLEKSLLELVKIRSSQINACANCLNIHTSDASKAGEAEQRIHLVAAWEEAPCYTPRERAALGWTEHLTQVATKRAPDHVFAALEAEFSPEEQVQLTLAINVINGWNRLAVGFHLYDPALGWAE